MKNYLRFTLSALTIFTFVACGTDHRSEQSAGLATPGGGEKADTAGLCVGGQPSLVMLGGVLWKSMESIPEHTDSSIKTSFVAGNDIKGTAGKLEVSNSKATASAALSPEMLSKFETTAAAKTYINLGCADLGNELKSSLMTEVKLDLTLDSKEPVSKEVTRIYICGKQEVTTKMISLIANEIIIEDGAELTFNNDAIGNVAIRAEKLVLNGKSSILVKTADALKFSTEVPSFDLNVAKEVQAGADGKAVLDITSTGGSCIEAAATTEK